MGQCNDLGLSVTWRKASLRRMAMKAILLATVGVMLSSGLSYAESPSGPKSGHPAVLTNAECNGVWKDAVGGGDILTRDKAAGYISDFAKADANRDGKISQTEFRQACKKGLVRAEHAESAKMGKDEGTHPGGVGESPPIQSGKMRGQ
jgi:EF hand domain-containing protein